MAPTGPEEEVEGIDEEFLHHVARGSERLAAGELPEAIHSLQRASALRPKDVKVAGLLGQACYRAGRYEEAVAAYGRLVDRNPTEVAARVNLGLANLKAGRHDEAVRQFTVVLDLNPDHRKAMGYLGLARLEAGDAAGARAWFERAGMAMMVARCDELVAGGRARGDGPGEAPEAGAAAAPGEGGAGTPGPGREAAGAEGPPAGGGAAAGGAGPEAAPAEGAAEAPAGSGVEASAGSAGTAPAGSVEPEPSAPSGAAPASGRDRPGAAAGPLGDDVDVDEVVEAALEQRPEPPRAAGGLEELVAGRLLRVDPRPYAVEGSTLAVAVSGRALARVGGLFAVRGEVALVPEPKRFRGKATDRPFGEGPDRMCRALGEGTLLFRTDGQVFTPMSLGGDAGYFREDAVFAMEDRVTFENGRVPAKTGRDLDLVHLRGQGSFLLRTAGEPVALPVARGVPLRVPAHALVGWTGALTPRIVPLAGEPGTPEGVEGPSVVELTGDGRALVDPDADAAE